MQEHAVPDDADDQHHRQAPVKGGHDRLGPLHIEHVGRAAGGEHGKQARQGQRGQKRVGDHGHQQLPVDAVEACLLRDESDAQQQNHP